MEKNAHLFNDASSSLKPSQSENRKRKNPPLEEASTSLSSKKTKADHSETDEVSGSLTLRCQPNVGRFANVQFANILRRFRR